MSITFSNPDNAVADSVAHPRSAIVRRFAWWGSAATGAVITNTALLFALLYWFAVFE